MGTWIFRVMVIDGNSASASTGQITFNVGVLPMGLGPPPPTTVTALTNTSHQFMATGGMPPYTYTKSGTLPVGMTVTQGGLLTGYPHTGGTFTFSVQAKDVLNASVTQTYTFTVVPPKITSGAPGPAQIGKPYSHTFTATPGRIGTVTFERLTGFIPPGLSLTSAGVLSGTPTSLGAFSFVVHATFKVSTYTFDNYQQVKIAVTPPPTSAPPTTPVPTTRPPDAQNPDQSSANGTATPANATAAPVSGTAPTSADGSSPPGSGALGPAEPQATVGAGGTAATSGDIGLLWWLIVAVVVAAALAIWLLRRHRTPRGDQS